ncbi:hypothetical protein CspeluHIS016_0803400 [Cutaneotrichosporon spelunceum]|uniref:Protein kinase domain-containing protein n=1 Tax=Cutaneotrichosporon spelunceum TaxID=1672016 RepID=A0AAD3U031_9TREE|nr:hypothetical protein CspeluHIS016_0803400 [Cutaneotrichosporon spelunceum]
MTLTAQAAMNTTAILQGGIEPNAATNQAGQTARQAWKAHLIATHAAGKNKAKDMWGTATGESRSRCQRNDWPNCVFKEVTDVLKTDLLGFGIDAKEFFGRGAPAVHIMRRLGRGGFGTVYDVVNIAGQRFAMKVLVNLRTPRETWCAEARSGHVLASVPGFIRVHETECTPDFLFMLQDLGAWTLEAELQAGVHSPARRLFLGAKLSLALRSLDEHRLVHLDLKPENVVLTMTTPSTGAPYSTEPAIIDLGLSMASLTPLAKNKSGTRLYQSPEVALDGSATPAADVWALGLMLWQIMASPDCDLRELAHQLSEWEDVQEGFAHSCSITGGETPVWPDWLYARILQRGPTDKWFSASVWSTPFGKYMREIIKMCLVVSPHNRTTASSVAWSLGNMWENAQQAPDAHMHL